MYRISDLGISLISTALRDSFDEPIERLREANRIYQYMSKDDIFKILQTEMEKLEDVEEDRVYNTTVELVNNYSNNGMTYNIQDLDDNIVMEIILCSNIRLLDQAKMLSLNLIQLFNIKRKYTKNAMKIVDNRYVQHLDNIFEKLKTQQ